MIAETAEPLPHELPGAPRYSITRAIRRLATGSPLNGLELEVSQELRRRNGSLPRYSGRGSDSFAVPWSAPVSVQKERRTGVLNQTTGTGAIPTIVSTTFIDALRPRMILGAAGAQIIEDLKHGNYAIPINSATTTLVYVGDGSAASGTANPTVNTQTLLSPTTLTAFCDVTTRVLHESPTVESILIADLLAGAAHEVDRAGLNGSGSSNQPTGLLNDSNISVYAWGTNGSAPTLAGLAEQERLLGVANGDTGPVTYVTSPAGRSVLRRTDVTGPSGTSGRYLMSRDNRLVIGVPAFATTSIPSNLTKGSGSSLSASILGDFSSVVVGLYGAPEVAVNPFLASVSGVSRVSMFLDFAVARRQTGSFINTVDMITT